MNSVTVLEKLKKDWKFHKEAAQKHAHLADVASKELQRKCTHPDSEVVWVDRIYISDNCHQAMCTQCGKKWSLCGLDMDEKAKNYKEVGLLEFECLESEHR